MSVIRSVTRKEMVKELSKKTGVPMTKVRTVIDALSESVTEHLIKGDRVAIEGLGTFSAEVTAPKMGRLTASGVRKKIPPHLKPVFTYAKNIRRDLASIEIKKEDDEK